MKSKHFTAWRFSHPDFDIEDEVFGLRVTNSGRISLISDEDSIRQSVIFLITTIPGERVMRPDYGCELYKLTYSPNDETTHGLAIHYIRNAITRWETRVEILHIDAQCNPAAPERMEISLVYRVEQTLQDDTLNLSFNLQSA